MCAQGDLIVHRLGLVAPHRSILLLEPPADQAFGAVVGAIQVSATLIQDQAMPTLPNSGDQHVHPEPDRMSFWGLGLQNRLIASVPWLQAHPAPWDRVPPCASPALCALQCRPSQPSWGHRVGQSYCSGCLWGRRTRMRMGHLRPQCSLLSPKPNRDQVATPCGAFDTVTNLDYSTGNKLMPYAYRTIAPSELRMNVLRISSTSASSREVLRTRRERPCAEGADPPDAVVFCYRDTTYCGIALQRVLIT